MDTQVINDLTGLIDKQAQRPLAMYENAGGTVSYTISGQSTINGVNGYKILRISTPTGSHTFIDQGFLLESSRLNGANGSTADVNLKTDSINSLLLLTDSSITYS